MSATKLTTARLELHPLDAERDTPALHAIRSDRRVWSTMGDSEPPTADSVATRMAGNGGWSWTIRAAVDRQIIGSVSLFPGDEVWRSLTWYLHPEHWGNGLASEAVAAAVDHLLGTAGFAWLDAWIDHTNRRSIGVARNAGMTEHGRMAYYSDLQVDEERRVERYPCRHGSSGAGSASWAASSRSRSASFMTGTQSSAASMAAAVRGAGGHKARLITFEKDSSGVSRAFRNRSYACRSIDIVFVAMHVCVCVLVCHVKLASRPATKETKPRSSP